MCFSTFLLIFILLLLYFPRIISMRFLKYSIFFYINRKILFCLSIDIFLIHICLESFQVFQIVVPQLLDKFWNLQQLIPPGYAKPNHHIKAFIMALWKTVKIFFRKISELKFQFQLSFSLSSAYIGFSFIPIDKGSPDPGLYVEF